jgi:hypothetical protein
MIEDDKLIEVLEGTFKETCAFSMRNPHHSTREIIGDLYTRLKRNFSLYSLRDILCLDNILLVRKNTIGEIEEVHFGVVRYSNDLQNSLVNQINSLIKAGKFNFELYSVQAKLENIISSVENFKVA